MGLIRTLVVGALLLSPPPAKAQDLLPLCQSALSACDQLTKAQDAQAKLLQDQVAAFKAEAYKGSTGPSIWSTVGLGAAAGGFAGVGVGKGSDVVLGSLLGGLTGLAYWALTQGTY